MNAERAEVLAIIPAHNEAGNLPHVLGELRALAALSGGLCLDVVVVDDASSDETASVAEAEGARVVRLPCNLGYGGAVQTGFKYGLERGYAYAVLLDGDGQHDPRCIPDLLAPVAAGEADIAIGSRFLGTLSYRVGPFRRVGMALFGRIVRQVTGRRVTDPTSGFQAMNRRVLAFFARDNYPADYPDADTLLLLHFVGLRATEVPVCMRGRLSGVSMHGSWKAFYYLFKMLLSILIVLLRHRSLQSAGLAGLGAEASPLSSGGEPVVASGERT